MIMHRMKLYYECADLAKIAGIGPQEVRRLIRAGRLVPSAVTRRGGALFDEEAAKAWLAARSARPARKQ